MIIRRLNLRHIYVRKKRVTHDISKNLGSFRSWVLPSGLVTDGVGLCSLQTLGFLLRSLGVLTVLVSKVFLCFFQSHALSLFLILGYEIVRYYLQ